MGDAPNYGIVGDVRATNVVVGPHGRIDARGDAAEELAARIAALERAVAGFAGPPEATAQLTAAAEQVTTELHSERPDSGKVRAALAAIGSIAGTAGGVAEAASGLLTLVEHLF